MSRNIIDQSYINFAAYKGSNEYLGITKVTLPDIKFLTQNISGAGIAGNIEAVIAHVEAMTLNLDFRTTTEEAMSLLEPTRHHLELRVARQDEDVVEEELTTAEIKHVFVVIPKNYKGGSIAPASTGDASGEYAVRYWKCEIDDETVIEIDPLNYVIKINGVDYGRTVARILGK